MTVEAHAAVLFFASSHALRAEKVLGAAGLDCRLMPVPRHLSSDCGFCLRIERGDQAAARQKLEQARVDVAGIHEI